jgi:tRNA A-37 threonylcarbamoyl transferase component Bud32
LNHDANDRWERVSSLFAAARALQPDSRDAFLTLACKGDVALRAEVEALLSEDKPDDGFLEDAPWSHLGQSLTESLTGSLGLTSGQVLKNRYCIDRELATGGQALVYLAHDQHLAMRPVVIKVMRIEGRRSRWLKTRFEQEMHALARIDHPGVVGIVDVGELEDGSPFLAIQYIPGVSLSELLSHGPIPPARAAEIIRQMGRALHAAHAAGVAHRDLKPGNIMLQQRNDGGDIVRLIDFGIAKIDRSDLEPETTAVTIAGTIRYMAPEQLEGKHSAASDVYAMALVACEMIGGYPHIRALPASTSRETRAVLESALSFRVEERPTDVQAWSESLADTLGPRRRRMRRVAVGLALLVIALAVPSAIEWKILRDRVEPVRIVEKVGAFDPLTEGFEVNEDVTRAGVTENSTHTGYDGWRIETASRGLYVRSFTSSQTRRAMDRGWKLTAVLRAEKGAAYAAAEFGGGGLGFPIHVLAEDDREIVRLPTQIVPEFRGMDLEQRPAGAYHRYELRYDAALKTADLWIDGERRLTGYRGWTQNTFRLGAGLNFGVAVYESDHGVGSFRLVRFEINP